jgi:hypothetical protein
VHIYSCAVLLILTWLEILIVGRVLQAMCLLLAVQQFPGCQGYKKMLHYLLLRLCQGYKKMLHYLLLRLCQGYKKNVALSTTETEYVAAVEACKEMTWL